MVFLSPRRNVAVVAVFLLVAGLFFTAPVSADDPPPSPSYLAMFDACEDIPPSEFGDLPSDQAQIDNISCIAHFGITKGTSETTYAPDDAVIREHMALFLIRLASRVGIAIPSAGDFVFSDIGHLSAESRVAINQLAGLGITKGTSATTFSPDDPVSRWQMALFIARLMDKMEPVGNEVQAFGYTPADVVETAEREVAAPFTDLGDLTIETIDAITHLYELGVVTGASGTEYDPGADITRATMADFMAALLDHSNLRPAGLNIRETRNTDFGSTGVVVMVSVRDEGFGPVEGQLVDVFRSDEENGGLDDQGACVPRLVSGDCTWGMGDSATDERGNIWVTGRVEEGDTAKYYAWIGAQEGALFDADEDDEVTLSITPLRAEVAMMVTPDVREHADSNKVHLGRTRSVTVTVQLVDFEDKAVHRPGIGIQVSLEQRIDGTLLIRDRDEPMLLTTDEEGKATFRVEGLEDDENDASQNRTDRFTFRYLSGALTGLLVPDALVSIQWVEEPSQTYKAVSRVPDYMRVSAEEVTIRASVTLYDQYGNGHRTGSGQQVGITIGGEALSASVSPSGTASAGTTLHNQRHGSPVTVSFTADSGGDGVDLDSGLDDPPDAVVQVVTAATSRDDGEDIEVHTMFPHRNRFLTEAGDGDSDAKLLFYYKRADTFLADDDTITIEEFETLLTPIGDDENQAVIDIVTYDREGTSVFKIVRTADASRP